MNPCGCGVTDNIDRTMAGQPAQLKAPAISSGIRVIISAGRTENER